MAYDQTLADTQRELEAARQKISKLEFALIDRENQSAKHMLENRELTARLAAAERDAARWRPAYERALSSLRSYDNPLADHIAALSAAGEKS